MPRGLKPNLAPEEKKKSRNHARLKEIETEIINAKEGPRAALARFRFDLLIGRRRELADGRAPIRFEDLSKSRYRSIWMIDEALEAQKQLSYSREETMLLIIRDSARSLSLDKYMHPEFLPHPDKELALVNDKLTTATDFIRYKIKRFSERRLHREIVIPYWPSRNPEPELPTPLFEDLSKPPYRRIGMIKDALKAQKRNGYGREETLLLIIRDYAGSLFMIHKLLAKVEPHFPPLKPLTDVLIQPILPEQNDEPVSEAGESQA